MYTSGTSPVAMWWPSAMPIAAPSLATITWRVPSTGVSSSAQKVAMHESGTPATNLTPVLRTYSRNAFGSTFDFVLAGSASRANTLGAVAWSVGVGFAFFGSGVSLSTFLQRLTPALWRRAAGSSSIIVITFLIGIIASSTSFERPCSRIASATESIAGYEARSRWLA